MLALLSVAGGGACGGSGCRHPWPRPRASGHWLGAGVHPMAACSMSGSPDASSRSLLHDQT